MLFNGFENEIQYQDLEIKFHVRVKMYIKYGTIYPTKYGTIYPSNNRSMIYLSLLNR